MCKTEDPLQKLWGLGQMGEKAHKTQILERQGDGFYCANILPYTIDSAEKLPLSFWEGSHGTLFLFPPRPEAFHPF